MIAEQVTPDSPWWPRQLLTGPGGLEHPPVQLWVIGDVTLLTSPMLGVVGSRASTHYGDRVAWDIAGFAAEAGYTIVSGGSFGIDTVAHRAATTNGGKTVVVLGSGTNHLYPVANVALFHQIVDNGGAIISEYPPDTVASRHRFLERNRIIAALADATVVVEAGRRSGTLNMAGWANQLDRPLMAVPGPVTSATSMGCHELIQAGAELVVGGQDVVELLQRGGNAK